jgi:hypothetical protein
MRGWRWGLRAEWTRLSRRWDIALVCGLVLAACAAIYFGSFRSAVDAMGVGNPGSWGPVPGAPPPDDWFLAAMLSLRAPYAFPASLVTVLDASWLLPAVGVYAAVVTVGGDFGWGTLRPILIARRSRAAFLAQRFVAIAVVTVACLATLEAAAILMQAGLSALAGERFPASALSAATWAAVLGARLAAALAFAAVALLLTVVARSVFGGIALTAVFAAVNLGLQGLPADGWSGVLRDTTLSGSAAAVLDRLRPPPVEMVVDYEAGVLVPAAHQPAAAQHSLPPELAAAVLLAWLFAALAIALWRLRSMDVTE